MLRISDEERHALKISRAHLFSEGRALDSERTIFGPIIRKDWIPQCATGKAAFPICGHPQNIEIRWQRYTSHATNKYLPAEAHLGEIFYEGSVLQVTEDCLRIYQTNSGAHIFDAVSTASSVICCDELLRASAEDAQLEFENDTAVVLQKTWNDDVFHSDCDWKRTYIKLTINLASGKSLLRRIFLRDVSQ